MREHVCWHAEGVHLVVNTEAEAVSPAVFKAVHTAWDLRTASPVGTRFQDLRPENYVSVPQDDLLRDFLSPNAAYRRIAVFGRTGSGKSHLIHWLKLQIPSTSDRLVVVVPKAGTSLRSILEGLIAELPTENQVAFREALSGAGDAMASRQAQKERLLFEISYALSELKPAPESKAHDLERELIKELPYLFQDPHFREKHFQRDGGIVAELVDHIFAAPTAYRPVEQRRAFAVSDLPVDPLDFKDASLQARHALQYLYGYPGAKEIAIDLVNRALEGAIGRALSFTGDRLVALMRELRRHLKSQDRDLVLLIEDFARVQGLDRALLQAMIEQGDATGELCNLRWAIAVTTGFFEQVVDTVYMRISHFVDMDRSAGRRDGHMDASAVADFAGPYLNAVRLGARVLEVWGQDPTRPQLPNACSSCSERPGCHETFGVTRTGHGLYPFTRGALWNMAGRVDSHLEDAFNPRTLQSGVLLPVLHDSADALAVGQFPPGDLLNKMGGYQGLDAAARRELARRVPGEEGRLGALLELWDGSGHVVNLPDGIREAFGVPAIPDAEVIEDSTGGDGADERPPEPVVSLSAEEREIEVWAAKGAHLDRAVDKLRRALFDAISDAIDWDDLGLERTRFASSEDARPFRRRSISFTRQATRATPSIVTLEIPGANAAPEAFDRVAVALLGLLRAEREGHWDFKGGALALATYLDCLAEWRDDVIGQLRRLTEPRETWNHAVAAAELLAVGNALNGRLKVEADNVADLSALLAETWPSDIAPESTELRRLYDALAARRGDLRDQVRALCSGAKGGQAGSLIHPGASIEALRRLRANGWRLAQTPPVGLEFEPFRKTAELYRRTAEALEAAAAAELTSRLSWVDEMDAAFGTETKRAEIVSAVTKLRTAFSDAGLAPESAVRRLDEALEEFRIPRFDEAVQAARSLREAYDAVAQLPIYARFRGRAVAAGRAMATALRDFMDQAASRLEEQRNRVSSEEQAVAAHIVAIESALEAIEADLRLEDRHVA